MLPKSGFKSASLVLCCWWDSTSSNRLKAQHLFVLFQLFSFSFVFFCFHISNCFWERISGDTSYDQNCFDTFLYLSDIFLTRFNFLYFKIFFQLLGKPSITKIDEFSETFQGASLNFTLRFWKVCSQSSMNPIWHSCHSLTVIKTSLFRNYILLLFRYWEKGKTLLDEQTHRYQYQLPSSSTASIKNLLLKSWIEHCMYANNNKHCT